MVLTRTLLQSWLQPSQLLPLPKLLHGFVSFGPLEPWEVPHGFFQSRFSLWF